MNAPVLPPPQRPQRTTAAEPTAGGRRHLAALTLIGGAAAAVYALYGLLRLRAFGAGTYDLVIFDQAVRGYASFGPPVSIAKGVHNEFGTSFTVLGDHWSPILATLAPLYWIHDGPATLIIAQAVLMALAIPPLWVFTRRIIGTVPAYLVAVAFALSWPVAQAVAFDFHEVAFAVPLTALLIERFQAGRRWHGIAVAGALLLVKEDMGLLVAGYGAYLLVAGRSAGVRGARRIGAVCCVGGLAAVLIATRVLIPAFGGDADYYWAYGHLGPDAPSALWHMVTHPWETLRIAVSPAVKADTLLWLGLPLLFLPLASPLTLAALPLLAERMLAQGFPNWWGTQHQYNAFVVVVLFCAAVDGMGRSTRLVRRRRRGRVVPGGAVAAALAGTFAGFDPRRGWAAAVLAVALLAVPNFALGDLLDPEWYGRGERTRAAAAAVAAVPDGVLVEAANDTGPHLSSRTRVLLWDRTPRGAPWVVADIGHHTFPFPDVTAQRERVRTLRDRGYQVLFERAGYVVLHRPGGRPAQVSADGPAGETAR